MKSAASARGVRVLAHAKVNLRLRILAREESGYHQLETIFLRLELADVVRVRVAAGRSLDVSGEVPIDALGPVEKNLAWRAAMAYANATGGSDGWAIEIDKRIPIGGGLGGGSADAGAVLRALDAIAPAPLGEARLVAIAASLGADVPFLATSHACALAWGRGERLLRLDAPQPRAVALLVPPFGVNTAEAYQWLSGSREHRESVHRAVVLDPASLSRWDGIDALAVNDFEPVVTARHPEIRVLVRWLRAQGCAPAMLSGSGSVVFGVLPSASPAVNLAGAPGAVLVTRTLARVEQVSALD